MSNYLAQDQSLINFPEMHVPLMMAPLVGQGVGKREFTNGQMSQTGPEIPFVDGPRPRDSCICLLGECIAYCVKQWLEMATCGLCVECGTEKRRKDNCICCTL